MDRRSADADGAGARRLVAAVVAIVVFGAAAAFAWQVFERARPSARAVAFPSGTSDGPWVGVPDGWTELSAPSATIRGGTLVWTGAELILWGGTEDEELSASAKAFAYDPAMGTWSELPAPPFGTYGASGFWTGREALFWGGQDPASDHADGVAFDPATRTWRRIAAAPIDAAWGGAAVWSGHELIVFGGGIQVGDPRNVQAAAYDPASDAWRRLPDAPIGLNRLSGTWTGSEAVFFGSLQDGNNRSETPTAVGVAYDPSSDGWRTIAPSPLNPQATSIVASPARIGGLFATDYLTQAVFYDDGTDTWGDPWEVPLQESECGPTAAVVRDMIFVWYCGTAATYDAITGYWQRVDGGMTAPKIEADGVAYPLFQSATLASAGDVVAFAGEGITIEDGIPCYGCADAPPAFWVYRPPSSIPSAEELTPPVFESSAWQQVVSTNDPAVADPQGAPTVWVTNRAFAADDADAGHVVEGVMHETTWPWRTIETLPPDGIVIVVSVVPTWTRACCGHFPPAALPLQLADAEGGIGWEGQVRPNISQFALMRFAGGRDVEVRVFFGSPDPGEELFSEAQAELDRLVIAPPSVASDRPGDPAST